MTTRLADTQFSCVKVASCYRVCGTSSSFITQTCNISNKIKLATKLPSFKFMWVCELKQWKKGKKGGRCTNGLNWTHKPTWLASWMSVAIVATDRSWPDFRHRLWFLSGSLPSRTGGKTSFYQTQNEVMCILCLFVAATAATDVAEKKFYLKNVVPRWGLVFTSCFIFCSHKMRLINYVA